MADSFSLVRGGPFYWLERRIGMAGEQDTHVAQRAVLAVASTWVVMFVLSALQGNAWGKQVEVPFLLDYAAGARFLIALPVLILSEIGIDRRLRSMAVHFASSGLVSAEEMPDYDREVARISALRDRKLPELLLFAASFLSSVAVHSPGILLSGLSSWHSSPLDSRLALTYAGWWFELICSPLFRFLLLRWLWRMALWGVFLSRISRLGLNLDPAHADTAAGLGFLSEGQTRFGSIAFAGSVVIAAQAINALHYHRATMATVRYVIVAYCVFAVLLFVSPLLVLIPRLVRVKRRGLLEYSTLATECAMRFNAKWIEGQRGPDESLLGSPDPQSFADFTNMFGVVRDMRVAPIFKHTLIGLAIPAVLPMIPVILVATPFEEVIRNVLHFLLL